jgi:N6-adenosine-specific RNA methylase IME4
LIATRGKPKRLKADIQQVIMAPVSTHSRKPNETHDRIERLVTGPYLELFARRGVMRFDQRGHYLRRIFTVP